MTATSLLRGALLAGMTFLAAAGHAAEQTYTTGAFRNLDRIEADLQRGVSTREDVRRLLGEPNGTGGALFPTASHPSDVWAYENIESKVESIGGAPYPVAQMRNRWELLLIFFDGNLFDGFLWFTSGTEAAGSAK
jgi:hypothetical protein